VSRLWKSAAIVLIAIAVAFVYQRLIADKTVSGRVLVPQPAARIGSGSSAVVVTADGAVIRWFPPPRGPELPLLPLTAIPKGGHLAGSALQQVRILAAAPPALRPYLAGSHSGETGVDVETTSGIELRFGDASQAARKWRAAATVLADPEITALDYVDLSAPAHPAFAGSGHTLPPAP
jgi:cell division protein FtsQ